MLIAVQNLIDSDSVVTIVEHVWCIIPCIRCENIRVAATAAVFVNESITRHVHMYMTQSMSSE